MRRLLSVFGAGVAAACACLASAGSLEWVNREPGPRMYASMAYDSSRHTALMFGGQLRVTGTLLADTWVWNGTIWVKRNVPGPSARTGAAMAYDSVRGVTVLFGGTTASGVTNETWEWNGVKWTLRTASGPVPRTFGSMCFDSSRNVTVLYGGNNPSYCGDTWEWNGTTWTLRANSGPSPRTNSTMVFDSVRGKSMLMGGKIGNPGVGPPLVTGEAWTWDGTTWTLLPGAGPTSMVCRRMPP